MATYIKTLKEDNGDIVYPQTSTDAIYTSGGETLETRISKYVTAEDIAQSVQSFGTVTVGMLDWSGIMDKIYPVGSIFMSATLSTPAAVGAALGGTWVAWGSGRVPVGVDTSDTDFDTAEETGGSKTHQHQYGMKWGEYYGYFSTNPKLLDGNTTTWKSFEGVADENWSETTLTTGSSTKSNATRRIVANTTSGDTLQPYITCYMYKRTA